MYKLICACMLATGLVLAQTPTVLTLSPSTGEGLDANLTITVMAPNGVENINEIGLMIKQDMHAEKGCVLFHYPGSETVQLRSDTGLSLGAPVRFGTPDADSNSQCTVVGGLSAVSVTRDTYTLGVHLHFAKAFAGLRRIWAQIADRNEPEASRWTLLGEWVVPQRVRYPGRIDRIKVTSVTQEVELSSKPANDVEPKVHQNGLLLAPAEDYVIEDRKVMFLSPVREGDVIQVEFQPSCPAT